MQYRHWSSVAAVGLALGMPAYAHDKEPSEKFDATHPEALFKGLIREDDVTLFFDHLRASMAAAARGEQPAQSEALNRRAEVLQRELAVRSRVLVNELLTALEAAARRAVREELNGPVAPKAAAPRADNP
jgi:hypothetical protein